ncbi:HEAT repeat domain-containing protein [Chitinophaga sedimenti]|uniref:HEAT repeat domain-containing protein n=1 Tax=Chitinophaga sedimenti TaxID=2033606 RepID=UPI002004C217|nr:HEAT repeat domain-containing protein [Chitinophaga sedimenti]MCK7555474.1 HEAT repeat domain-containing protein [Chitinophaga sedimenti]
MDGRENVPPRWDGQAAYITPCIANYVSGPCGMVYNPGTALGPEYKNNFFIAEFVGNPSGSGVHAFKLNPKGASFDLGESKRIVSGILPTGMDFGPDGALYIADWIDGWDTHNYGRIWKMDVKGAAGSAARKEVQSLLAADFGDKKVADLANLLKHEDMRIRMKAQFELVKRKDSDVFKAALAQKTHQLSRVHGIWGLAQLARQDKKHAEALVPVLRDADPEIRAQAAKWLGDIRYAEAGAALIPLLKDTASRARFFAAEALGRMKYKAGVQPIIAMLEANNDTDAYLRHAGAAALANIHDVAPVAALSTHPSRALRIAAVVALRRMSDPAVARFLSDTSEFIVTEAARAINDDLSIPEALPALAGLLNTTTFKNEPLVRRIISANLRVAKDENLQNLVTYAQQTANPAPMRAEAVDVLSVWSKPSVLDRVDGRLRGPVTRDAAPVVNKAATALTGLLNDKEIAVRLSAAKAIQKINIKTSADQLLATLKADKEPKVRIASLKAIVSLQAPQAEQAISTALADKEKDVRVAGLDLMEKMSMSKEVMVKLLNDVIANRTMEEKQAAVLALGKLPVANTQQSFDALLAKMAAGTLSPDIYRNWAKPSTAPNQHRWPRNTKRSAASFLKMT